MHACKVSLAAASECARTVPMNSLKIGLDQAHLLDEANKSSAYNFNTVRAEVQVCTELSSGVKNVKRCLSKNMAVPHRTKAKKIKHTQEQEGWIV